MSGLDGMKFRTQEGGDVSVGPHKIRDQDSLFERWIRVRASLVAQTVKNLRAMQKTWVWPLGWEDPLKKGKATHSSILAWRIPMDRGAWQATVHGVTESDMTEQLSTAQHLVCPGGLSGKKRWIREWGKWDMEGGKANAGAPYQSHSCEKWRLHSTTNQKKWPSWRGGGWRVYTLASFPHRNGSPWWGFLHISGLCLYTGLFSFQGVKRDLEAECREGWAWDGTL